VDEDGFYWLKTYRKGVKHPKQDWGTRSKSGQLMVDVQRKKKEAIMFVLGVADSRDDWIGLSGICPM
jgi:hypothetical protein